MRFSRTTRIAATVIGGVLGSGVLTGASASFPTNDRESSSSATTPTQRRAADALRDLSGKGVTLYSRDVSWEPGDLVGAAAEAPASEQVPGAETQVATESTLAGDISVSRSAGVGQCGTGDSWPNQVRSMITSLFGITDIGGYRPGDPGDHGSGLALDVMVPGDAGLGNVVANWAVANMGSLNISYVIWQQQINMGSGWSGMEDRGSITANHYDHVHISLNPGSGTCG